MQGGQGWCECLWTLQAWLWLSGWVVRVSGREAEPAGFPLCSAGSWVNN